MNYKIGASLACADQLNLDNEIKSLISCNIDFLHIDVMDGVYVNNYCFGTNIFNFLKKYENIEIEAHLMVIDPYNKIDFFKDKHISKLSFHIEASNNPIQTLAKIKNMGIECGIAINAATSESVIDYLYDYVDYFLIMTVEAGFSGQDFLNPIINKVKKIRDELNNRHIFKDIYVDGHIDEYNISFLSKAGANSFVGGSAGLFRKDHTLAENLNILKKSLEIIIRKD